MGDEGVTRRERREGPDALLAACYEDMRRIARGIVRSGERRRQLQPTDLVNEAVVRLIQSAALAPEGREHMLALAARTMRRVLIDDVRRGAAAKRQMPTLVTSWPSEPTRLIDVEALDAAVAALAQFSPEHARIVELRFTFGMTVEETARATGLAERTVKRRWQAARAWLQDHLGAADGSGS